jgi:hypothetical protein
MPAFWLKPKRLPEGEQHFRGDGQQTARAGRVGGHLIQLDGAGFKDRC